MPFYIASVMQSGCENKNDPILNVYSVIKIAVSVSYSPSN